MKPSLPLTMIGQEVLFEWACLLDPCHSPIPATYSKIQAILRFESQVFLFLSASPS